MVVLGWLGGALGLWLCVAGGSRCSGWLGVCGVQQAARQMSAGGGKGGVSAPVFTWGGGERG